MRRGSWPETRAPARSFLLLLVLAVGVVMVRPAQASSGRNRCSARGPCNSPDAVDYFASGAQGRGIVVTNFGILMPGAGPSSWQVVCDDTFGLALPPQIRLHPDGRVFAASNEGLYLTSDGCDWSLATGDLEKKVIHDADFDRQTPGQVFALADIPRKFYRSTDGGRSFSQVHAFADTFTVHRVVVAPSDSKRIYIIGRGRGSSTPFARSGDRGQTFEIGDLVTGATPTPRNLLEFVAVAPDDPAVLYFYVINPAEGDELWRTTDGGTTVSMVMRVQPGEAFSGLAFGSTTQTLYVAGNDPFPLGTKPAAHLYISRDGGKTWSTPLASGEKGPRYRCLDWEGGKLYACAAGEPGGDAFLIGVSSDEGQTWSPAVRLGELQGAKSCVQARCFYTEEWLCENYCYCAPGLLPSTGICDPNGGPTTPRLDGSAGDGGGGVQDRPGDGGASAACQGTACLEKQGCSCHLGDAQPASGAGGLLLVGLLLAAARRRRPRAP
jgi:MYXO-CTERM domain-containing protein